MPGTFSPDGRALLIRGIQGTGAEARYLRRIVPLNEISG